MVLHNNVNFIECYSVFEKQKKINFKLVLLCILYAESCYCLTLEIEAYIMITYINFIWRVL